jgi:hypothetical protein
MTSTDTETPGPTVRGAEVSGIFHGRGGFSHHAGPDDRLPGPDPQRRCYYSFASFSDPDGNNWILQEIRQRLPGPLAPPKRRSVRV